MLHPWLQRELTAIIAAPPPLDELPDAVENHAAWVRWREELSVRFTLLEALPPYGYYSLWTTSRAIRLLSHESVATIQIYTSVG
ncbi:MAG: hypothetical protein P9F75_17840 [Candidatus Contendobacter sp.]|nr:hypothetical protein [Candidatus Contendobacter sp.]